MHTATLCQSLPPAPSQLASCAFMMRLHQRTLPLAGIMKVPTLQSSCQCGALERLDKGIVLRERGRMREGETTLEIAS
jgi:hypothetical protein